jgi:hypothetical protein
MYATVFQNCITQMMSASVTAFTGELRSFTMA